MDFPIIGPLQIETLAKQGSLTQKKQKSGWGDKSGRCSICQPF
jgi:hypothetical protein